MVNHCLNPDCQKHIPENHNYCDEICLRWHIKIKRNNYFSLKLKPNPKSISIIPDRCKYAEK